MKKNFILFMLVAMIIAGCFAHAQEITSREWEIFNKYQEGVFDYGEGTPADEQDKVIAQVSEEYGITTEQFNNIVSRVLLAKPADRDIEIYNALSDGFDATPENATKEQKRQLYRDIANKYKVPLYEVSSAYMRVFYYKYMVEDTY